MEIKRKGIKQKEEDLPFYGLKDLIPNSDAFYQKKRWKEMTKNWTKAEIKEWKKKEREKKRLQKKEDDKFISKEEYQRKWNVLQKEFLHWEEIMNKTEADKNKKAADYEASLSDENGTMTLNTEKEINAYMAFHRKLMPQDLEVRRLTRKLIGIKAKQYKLYRQHLDKEARKKFDREMDDMFDGERREKYDWEIDEEELDD